MQRHEWSLVTFNISESTVSKNWKTSAVEKGEGSKSRNKQKKITIFCSINSKFLIFLCCLLQWLSNICRIQFNMPWKFGFPLKLLSAIIYQIFIFYEMIALEKLWKMLFMSSKKLFLFSKYSNFCVSILPSFSPCWPLF